MRSSQARIPVSRGYCTCYVLHRGRGWITLIRTGEQKTGMQSASRRRMGEKRQRLGFRVSCIFLDGKSARLTLWTRVPKSACPQLEQACLFCPFWGRRGYCRYSTLRLGVSSCTRPGLTMEKHVHKTLRRVAYTTTPIPWQTCAKPSLLRMMRQITHLHTSVNPAATLSTGNPPSRWLVLPLALPR